MLKEKIMEWLGKTFGKPRHRDLLEMTHKVAEISEKGAQVLIEELSFIFQRIKYEASEKDVNKWKRELDEITGNALRGFHFGNEELYGIATAEDVKRGAQEGELVKGKGLMLNVQIHKRTFLANSIFFPSRNLNPNRRH